jgi:hypothetical protein
MPRVIAVVVGVGLLVWGMAFVDFGRPRARRDAAAVESPAAAEPGSGVATKERAIEVPSETPRGADPDRAIEARPMAAAPPGVGPRVTSTASSATVASAARSEALLGSPDSPARGALSTATGELGEGYLSPEYAEMERSYTLEPRDGHWAEVEEERLRAMLAGTSLAASVALVNCQETLCRLMFESDDHAMYRTLLSAPGFKEATGLGDGSPYSHRSGQLSVYFSRRGGPGTR